MAVVCVVALLAVMSGGALDRPSSTASATTSFGGLIAFAEGTAGNCNAPTIKTLNAATGSVTTLGPGLNPVFSPDGTRIAFANNGGYWVMKADGSGLSYVADGVANRPQWSPDGTKLVVAGTDGIQIVPINGSAPTGVTTAAGTVFESGPVPTGGTYSSQALEDTDPAWSPTGNTIVFSRSSITDRVNTNGVHFPAVTHDYLYSVNADGTGLRQLTGGPLWMDTGLTNDDQPNWSPDGRTIAYRHVESGSEYQIYTVDAAGGTGTDQTNKAYDPTTLNYTASSTWSPSGQLTWAYAEPGAITVQGGPVLYTAPGGVCGLSWASGGLAPVASFTYSAASATYGSYQFISTSTDPDGAALTLNWTISDGTVATGPAFTHTFTRPGTYTVALTASNGDGKSSTTSQSLVVAAPALEVAVSAPSTPGLALGSTITAHVQVSAASAGVGSLTHLAFDGGSIASADPATSVDLSGSPAAPGPFSLDPGAAVGYDVPVKITALGKVVVTSAVSGVDANGSAVHDSGFVTLAASGLQVVLTADPATAVQDDDPATGKPEPVIVSVKATVTNTSPEDVTGVSIDASPTLARSGGLPAPVPFPVDVTGQASPSPTIGTIGAGASKSVTYELKVNGAIKFDATALVQAVDSATGVNIFGVGRTTVNIQPQFPLSLDATRVDDGDVTAGTAWLVTGTLTNQTTDRTFVISPLDPTVGSGASWRDERQLTESFPGSTPTSAGCVINRTVRLGPGESYVFHARVLTVTTAPLSADFASTVSFAEGSVLGQEVITTPSGETHTPLDPSQVFFTREVSPTTSQLNANVVAPAFEAGSDEDFFLNFGLGFFETSYIDSLVDNLNGAQASIGAAVASIEEFHQVFINMTPDERSALFSTTASALGNYLGDDSAGTADKLTLAANTGIGDLETWWNTNTASTRGYTIGGMTKKVAGDLTLGAVTEVAACEMLTTARYVDAARLTETALAEDAQLAADGGLRIDKGLAGVPAGAAVTPELMAARLGLSPAEYAAIQAAADKYGVSILVRSRASSASGLVDLQEAIVKPLSVKPKGLNDLDRILFGLKSDQVADASTIVAQRMPEATQADVVALGRANGLTDTETDALVSRWQQRSHEWEKYGAQLTTWADQGYLPIEFPTVDNVEAVLTESKALPVNRAPFVEGRLPFRLQPTPGAPDVLIPQVEIQVKAADGTLTGEKRWVPIVGDVDLVGILNADGTTIADPAKLLAVDNFLANSAAQTQHPATLGWLRDQLAEGLLRDHLPGGEPMMVVAPKVQPRAAFFNPSMSLGADRRLAGGVKLVYLDGAPKYPLPVQGIGSIVAPAVLDNPTTMVFPASTWNTNQPLTYSRGPSVTIVRQTATGGYQQFTGGVWQDLPSLSTPSSGGTQPGPDAAPPGTEAAPDSTPSASARIASVGATPSATAAPGDPSPLAIAPETYLQFGSAAGDTSMSTIAQSDLALPGDQTQWFRAGDTVLIDPGGPHQEQAVIAGAGATLTFTEPLTQPHDSGELVAFVQSPAGEAAAGSSAGTVASSSSAPPTAPAAPVAAQLPVTGTDTGDLLEFGGLLIGLGACLVFLERNRRCSGRPG
jgi:PKD repeat protein